MSSDYGPSRFGNERENVGAVYGPVNCSPWTKVVCPVCKRTIQVPWGHMDTTHDCTLLCAWCGQTMQPIPPDPSTALVPLVMKTAYELMHDGWQGYFRYCPNSACPYLAANGVGYISKKVEVDILVGR
jgi:hypothetical protein